MVLCDLAFKAYNFKVVIIVHYRLLGHAGRYARQFSPQISFEGEGAFAVNVGLDAVAIPDVYNTMWAYSLRTSRYDPPEGKNWQSEHER